MTNRDIAGHGGELKVKGGKTVVLVTAFDYKVSDYGGRDLDGLGELSCSPDAARFANLAKAAGAQVIEMYDGKVANSQGFPDKNVVAQKIQQFGQSLGPDDTFVWFFAGHGTATDQDAKVTDGKENDTELCFCDQQGEYTPFTDNEIAQLLLHSFNEETSVLVVTDCCQSGTVCDLSMPEFEDRPVCHMAAVKDSQCAIDLGDGGAFTSCICEAIEEMVQDETHEFSIVQLFNGARAKFAELCQDQGFDPSSQSFTFERPTDSDPDEFMWPLVPPAGWEVQTALD